MTTSDTLAKLADALAKAQAKIEGAEKNKTNPAFKSRYADLAAVWDACRVALSGNGLSVVQAPSSQGAVLTVTTRLLHTSGEWIEDAWTMQARDASPQALMSCLTYARRGALAAMVGIAPEDDDGEAAQGRPPHVDARTGEIHEARPPVAAKPEAPKAAPQAAANSSGKKDTISEAQQKRLFAVAKGAGWSTDEIKHVLKDLFNCEHSRDVPWRQYDDVIAYFERGPQPDDPPVETEATDDTPF